MANKSVDDLPECIEAQKDNMFLIQNLLGTQKVSLNNIINNIINILQYEKDYESNLEKIEKIRCILNIDQFINIPDDEKSVGYANASGTSAYADEAGTANFANEAERANSATTASNAGRATYADLADKDGNDNIITETYLNKNEDGTVIGKLTLSGGWAEEGKYTDAVIRYLSVSGNDTFFPTEDNIVNLGSPYTKWKQIYSNNSQISTSDRTKKYDISYIGEDSVYDTGFTDEQLCYFMEHLRPVVCKFVDGDSKRPHHGLISQDVEDLIKEIGIDHAAFIKSPKMKKVFDEEGKETFEIVEGEYEYALRYEEFIGDIIRFCQILQNKLLSQKEEVDILKNEIKILKDKIEK